MNKRRLGTEYEQLALSYVSGEGAFLVERNFRCRSGEVDLILKDGGYLVFAEVKYRTDTRYGQAAEAVDRRKMRRICRVSDVYRVMKKLPEDTPVRYDVIAIDADGESGETPVRITWIRDAFPYTG